VVFPVHQERLLSAVSFVPATAFFTDAQVWLPPFTSESFLLAPRFFSLRLLLALPQIKEILERDVIK